MLCGDGVLAKPSFRTTNNDIFGLKANFHMQKFILHLQIFFASEKQSEIGIYFKVYSSLNINYSKTFFYLILESSK